MSNCEALATKAELNNKLDRGERPAIVQQAVGTAIGEIDPRVTAIGLIASGAFALAKSAGAAIASFLSQLGALTAAVASLAASVAVLYVLGARVDALEKYTDSIAKTANDAYGNSLNAIGIGRSNSKEIETLKQYDRYLKDIIDSQQREIGRLGYELTKANLEILRLGQELNKANAIIAKHEAYIAQLNQKYSEAKLAILAANAKAEYALQTAALLEGELREYAADTESRFAALERQVQAITGAANAATDRANRAIAEANKATDAANRAIAGTDAAQGHARRIEDDNTQLRYEIYDGGITRRWNIKVWEPVITNIQTRVDTQVKPIAIGFGAFERSYQELRTSIQRQFGSLTNIGLGNFERQLSENKKAVAALQGTIPKFDERVKNLETTTANTNTQVQTLTNTQTQTQERLREQERVNTQANTQLQGISDQIGNLPNVMVPALGVATVGIMLQSPSLKRMLTDTSAAGTCQTAQPGGCLGNQFSNLGNGLRQYAGDIANGTLNTAQMVLLKQIDAKLGAQVVGGIGGKLTNFMSWAIVDRVMNLVTMMATVHNAMMLSHSITDSFFNILDNCLNIGHGVAPTIFKDADGSAIDARQTISTSVDTYFKSLFGATEWTAIKAQWKAYSTIARSGANLMQNLQSLHNDTQQLCNQARNYVSELGNALQEEGVIGEDNWSYKDINHEAKSPRLSKIMNGLNQVDNTLQAIEQVTSTVLSAVNTTKEIKDNVKEIKDGIAAANKTAKDDRNAAVEGLELPNFSLDDLF